MHIIHRVVFQNLECLQRFGLPRGMASNAELLANMEEDLNSEQHALWLKWHVQLIKVALSKLSACIVVHAFAACKVLHALCRMHCAACTVLLPPCSLSHTLTMHRLYCGRPCFATDLKTTSGVLHHVKRLVGWHTDAVPEVLQGCTVGQLLDQHAACMAYVLLLLQGQGETVQQPSLNVAPLLRPLLQGVAEYEPGYRAKLHSQVTHALPYCTQTLPPTFPVPMPYPYTYCPAAQTMLRPCPSAMHVTHTPAASTFLPCTHPPAMSAFPLAPIPLPYWCRTAALQLITCQLCAKPDAVHA